MSRLKAQANSAKQSAFIRNSGYMNAGAAIRMTVMAAKAINSLREFEVAAVAPMVSAALVILPSPEQARRPDQEHDRHDDENHRTRRFGEKNLSQSFRDPERKTCQDRAHDRSHT